MEILNSLNNSATQQSLEECGFLIRKQLFDPNRIGALLGEIQSIFMIQARHKNIDISDVPSAMAELFNKHRVIFKNCGKQAQHLIDVWKLACDDQIISMLINSCGLKFPNICTRPVTMFNSKALASNEGYHTLAAHQDSASMRGSDNSVVIWLPLVEVTEELGPLEVIPLSHIKGNIVEDIDEFGFGVLPDTEINEEDFFKIEGLVPGDVVIFNSHLIHRSGILQSEGIRWTLQFRYNDLLDETFIEKGFPNPYIYRPMTKEELDKHG